EADAEEHGERADALEEEAGAERRAPRPSHSRGRYGDEGGAVRAVAAAPHRRGPSHERIVRMLVQTVGVRAGVVVLSEATGRRVEPDVTRPARRDDHGER